MEDKILRITLDDIAAAESASATRSPAERAYDLSDEKLFCPEPEPLGVTVEARCARTKKPYYLLFEQQGPHTWRLTRSIGALPIAGTTTSSKTMVSGNIDWYGYETGQAQCPHCGNPAFVQCNRCGGRITCLANPTDGSPMECAWCGSKGYVSGRIQQLEGSPSGKGKGKA